MQQHAGGHSNGLGSMYGYAVHVCGNVGGISGVSSRMELLGQPAVALTADCPAQGLVQVQECTVQGSAPVQECMACGHGVHGGIGSPEGDCLWLRGVTGQHGEREACVA